jgi:hypothetical protein
MDVVADMVDPSHRNEVVFPVGSIALCQLDLVFAIKMIDVANLLSILGDYDHVFLELRCRGHESLLPYDLLRTHSRTKGSSELLRPWLRCAGIAPLSRLMAIWRVRSARLRLGGATAPNPERLGFGGTDVHAENFAPAVTVDADRDSRRDRYDAPPPAYLHVGGVDKYGQSPSIGRARNAFTLSSISPHSPPKQ